MVPFSQDRIVIGAGPGLSVAAPDVQFLPADPGAALILAWGIASAPATLPAGPIGTILISIAYPDPIFVLAGAYAAGDVLSAGFVPNECALVGVPVYTQGAVLGASDVSLTNALDYVIGLL
jgi:hypothetical protein